MVDKSNPVDPTSGKNQPPKVGGSSPSKEPSGAFQPPPMTFAGMHFNAEESKQLWSVLIQTLNSQISKDKDKALAALKKMKESVDGEDN